ncbi:MAG: ATP-binding protein [Gemmatimonadaceae bacterium]
MGESSIQTDRSRLRPESQVLFAVVLYLAIERGRRIGRKTLTELFWAGVAPESGRHCLRQTIYKLKQLGVPIEVDGDAVWLPADVVDLDYERLSSNMSGVELAEAGEFLPAYAPDLSTAHTEWVEAQRAHVNGRLRRTLLGVMLERRSRGDWTGVELFGRKCLRIDPLNEEATLALAEATAMVGSKQEAIGIIDRYLVELGPDSSGRDIRVAPSVLRRRIAERLSGAQHIGPSLTRFRGREETMALLVGRLDSARKGRGSACLIWGGAGIGKTRVVAEVRKRGDLAGFRTVASPRQPSDEGRPLSFFVDVIPQLLALPGALGCDPASLALLKRLTDHDISVREPTADTHEAVLLRLQIEHAMIDLLDATAEENRILLVAEDCHWADAQSLELMQRLFGWVGGRAVMFLVTSRVRTPARANWSGDRRAESHLAHRLEPLGEAAARALVETMLRDRGEEPTEDFVSWAVGTAAGNPLFLVELARCGSATGYRTEIPPTLSAMLRDRVLALSAGTRSTLQSCALLGRNATIDRLVELLQVPTSELALQLQELHEQDLLLADGNHLQLRHELIAVEVVNLLAPPARLLLHRQIALLLEGEVERTGSSSLLWDCADHYRAVGEDARALKLAISCGYHLLQLGAPDEAVPIFERALAGASLQNDRDVLLRGLKHALSAAGRWSALLVHLQQEESGRKNATSNEARHSDLEFTLLETRWHLDTDLIELYEKAAACAVDPVASSDHRIIATTWACIFADNIGKPAAAKDLYDLTAPLISTAPPRSIHALHLELIYHAGFGDLDRALRVVAPFVEIARENDIPTLIRSLRHAGAVLRFGGESADAVALLRESYELSLRHKFVASARAAATQLAWLFHEVRDIPKTRAWYDASMQVQVADEERLFLEGDEQLLAYLALDGEQLELAEELAKSGLEATAGSRAVRPRLGALSIAVRVASAIGSGPIDDNVVRELEILHRQSRTMNAQDEGAYSLCLGLKLMGRDGEALDLLREYVRVHRRDRYPLPPEISAMLD